MCLSVEATLAGATTLEVNGWSAVNSLPLSGTPPLWLGDDPIAGRLSCPPLTRLEGNPLINAPVLLKGPPVVEKEKSGERWTFTLRPGLKWWSGTAIDGNALASWLADALPRVSQEKLGISLAHAPSITASGPLSATVQWSGSSPFGPYIFSGVSLARQSGKQYECAGLYAMKTSGRDLDLELNSGYKAKYSRITLANESHGSPVPRISFKLASDITQATSTAMRVGSCQTKIDVPLVTAIAWNPTSPLAGSAPLRQALTMITPRGDLLRTGAGELGALVSAPILRIHPGYDPKILVRPYNLQAGSQIFEENGFKQAHTGLPRTKSGDKNAVIHVGRLSGKQGLIEKVLGDSYASSGIEIQFQDVGAGASSLDGVLFSTFLPWTSLDFRQILKGPFPFAPVSDKSLSELAEAYSRSLTELKPDTGILSKIHERWKDVEPWTMLMSHQYCVVGDGIKITAKINVMDPDWFRHLTVD